MATTNSLIPIFEEAGYVGGTATVNISGGQLVKIAGNKQVDGSYSFAVCGAGDAGAAIGIAAFNALSGQRVTVAMSDAIDSILPLAVTAAVAAGDHLTTDTGGAVVTTTTAGTKCVAIALCASYANSYGVLITEAIMSRHTI